MLGFALLVGELLMPAFGVLGVGGIVAFIAGALLLFDREVPGLGVPLPLIFAVSIAAGVAVLLAGGMALRARRAPVVSGSEELLGSLGEVVQIEHGQAWALVHGERWQVCADAPLAIGQRVRVNRVLGLVLQVQPEADAAAD